MQTQNKQKGFTLIEIAIVLVIIGLLLGGVLKGQELIKSAKIKAAAADVNAYSVALIGYQDRYGDLFTNGANYQTPVTGDPDSAEMLKELADRGLISLKNQHALGGAIVLAKNGGAGVGTVDGLATSATATVSPLTFGWAICYRSIANVEDIQALIRAIDGASSDFAADPSPYESGRARLVVDTLDSAPSAYDTANPNTTVCFEI